MEYKVMRRYVRDGEIVTADVIRKVNHDGNISYKTDAEWYDIEDEEFDTFEEACKFLEGQGFTEKRAA